VLAEAIGSGTNARATAREGQWRRIVSNNDMTAEIITGIILYILQEECMLILQDST
jgi:hypothetical protein